MRNIRSRFYCRDMIMLHFYLFICYYRPIYCKKNYEKLSFGLLWYEILLYRQNT